MAQGKGTILVLVGSNQRVARKSGLPLPRSRIQCKSASLFSIFRVIISVQSELLTINHNMGMLKDKCIRKDSFSISYLGRTYLKKVHTLLAFTKPNLAYPNELLPYCKRMLQQNEYKRENQSKLLKIRIRICINIEPCEYISLDLFKLGNRPSTYPIFPNVCFCIKEYITTMKTISSTCSLLQDIYVELVLDIME